MTNLTGIRDHCLDVDVTATAESSPSFIDGSAQSERIRRAVADLDCWLETLRSPGGYGGPVVHWWQQSFTYTGPGLDWRYEGIIAGYLSLWRSTGESRWLHKARRAGNDLVAGQLSNSHYQGSAFELNPASAGTPHEAAADVALLLLARALQDAGEPDWDRYASCAERNLRSYFIEKLWDPVTQSFSDSVDTASFVPNKTATVCDALFLLAAVRHEDRLVEDYALPALRRIITHQVCGGPLDGAIAQNSLGTRRVEKYFPIYIARCVPALMRGYEWSGQEVFGDSALRAMRFIASQMDQQGVVPTVVYSKHRSSRGHTWIAPLGDVLRASDEVTALGFDRDMTPMLNRLLAGQDSSGGMQTATGFATQSLGRHSSLPDLRDVIHVAGWCDKAFRYLASHITDGLAEGESQQMQASCMFRGQPMQYRETTEVVEVTCRSNVLYRWCKGANWPEVASPEFWLR